jgi:NAD(P)-dependent dehydrogenase (short-subunit alcohol dehydrogenase family)
MTFCSKTLNFLPGLGRSLTKALIASGAKVLALSRSPQHLDTLKEECERSGGPGTVETHAIDLGADWDRTKQLVASIASNVDGLVNNAGIAVLEPFLEMTPENFDKQMNVNVKVNKRCTVLYCTVLYSLSLLALLLSVNPWHSVDLTPSLSFFALCL